jgi:hypothetical protein
MSMRGTIDVAASRRRVVYEAKWLGISVIVYSKSLWQIKFTTPLLFVQRSI